MAAERLQKILAQAGIASRRKIEELIQLGEITVNGKVAKLGDKAEFGKDAIKVSGKLVSSQEPKTYLAFNKPKRVISALSDDQGRASLSEFLNKIHVRVYPIGRLDFNSEGLLLLTNDGELAEKIQKRHDLLRVYQVKIKGHPEADRIEQLRRGARVPVSSNAHASAASAGERVSTRFIKPFEVRLAQNLEAKSMIEVVVQGPGAFDIKALFEAKGFLVERIIRTAIGHLTLHGIVPGHYRQLKESQVRALLDQPELGMRRLEADREEVKPRAEIIPRGSEAESPIKPRAKISARPGSFAKPRVSITPRPDAGGPSKPQRAPRRTLFAGGGRSPEPRAIGRPGSANASRGPRPVQSRGRPYPKKRGSDA